VLCLTPCPLEETARLVEKKVVRLAIPFRRWAEELDPSAKFQVQPYTIEILLRVNPAS
jgi:hypothetical protein